MRGSTGRSILVAGVAAAVVTVLSGCGLYIFPSDEMQDLAAIEESLDLEELGDVVCGQWNRPTPIDDNPYFHFFGVVGSDNHDELVDRLKGLGFELEDRVREDGTSLIGPDEEQVIVHKYTNPPTVQQFTPKDCDIPDEGLVTLSFTKYAQ